jgi:uncharacterized protein
MAVVTKYVVVRNGVELDETFPDKKTAEAYDKMLDAAGDLAAYIKDAGLKIDLDSTTIDALAVFLARNGPEVTRILKGLQPLASSPKAPPGEKDKDVGMTANEKKKGTAAKTKPKD